MQETLLNIVLIIVTDFFQFTNISKSLTAAKVVWFFNPQTGTTYRLSSQPSITSDYGACGVR